MDLAQRQNESDFDYHKRLVYGKLVDKTLADADYSELAELVYGKPYSSDVARRMLYGSRQTLELMDTVKVQSAKTSDTLSDIDAKIMELRKERQKFSDQRREMSKYYANEGRLENICEHLVKAADNLQPFEDMFNADVDWDFEDTDAVLILSDWHFGMIADNIYNKYNTDICIDRVKTVVNKAIQRIALHRCRRLHIVVLGDLIQGSIHVSARVASEELVADQIMKVSEILAQAIHHLSTFVEETDVYITYGNHARVVPNKKENIHRDNLERLIPWWLAQRLRNCESIQVMDCSANEFLFINSYGHIFCATHGDLDTVKTAPATLSTLLRKKCGMDVEYIILGDKHHRESMEEIGVTAILCGALCGSDSYANEHRLYSDPSQLLLIVNEECGVDAEYRLKC